MRLKNIKNAFEIIEENNDFVITNGEELKNNWSSIFGNDNPIHIEVGTGKGGFILGMAEAFPDINYIGIEKMDNAIVRAIKKVKPRKRDNLKLLRFDAKDLTDIFGKDEVNRVYLNFSDPWPKVRHEKRRLTYKSFLESYETICNTNELHFKTDNRELFEYSIVSLNNYGADFEFLTFDLHKLEMFNIQTEYETKFANLGQPIYRIEAILKGGLNNGQDI